MQTSTISISLFLLGSLLMSTTTILNGNLFSNSAMAQADYNNNNYDNYNYDDNNYFSKYPTEINKYECQKGPFEGFFVSSVEFCKHIQIDDNDRKADSDNKTDDKGPI